MGRTVNRNWIESILLLVAPFTGVCLCIISLLQPDTVIKKDIDCFTPREFYGYWSKYLESIYLCLSEGSKNTIKSAFKNMDKIPGLPPAGFEEPGERQNLFIDNSRFAMERWIPLFILFQSLLMIAPLALYELLSPTIIHSLDSLVQLRAVPNPKFKAEDLEGFQTKPILYSSFWDYIPSFVVIVTKISTTCVVFLLFVNNGSFLSKVRSGYTDFSLAPYLGQISTVSDQSPTHGMLKSTLLRSLTNIFDEVISKNTFQQLSFSDLFLCSENIRRYRSNIHSSNIQCLLKQQILPSGKLFTLVLFQILLIFCLILSTLNLVSILVLWLWSFKESSHIATASQYVKPKQMALGYWNEVAFRQFVRQHISSDTVFKLDLDHKVNGEREEVTNAIFDLWQRYARMSVNESYLQEVISV